MAIGTDSQIGMSMRFRVTIDNGSYDLGSWFSVKGLEVAWDLVEYRAGDADNERWYFPGVTKYTTVKLERAVQADDTTKVKTWLNSNSFQYEVQTGSVELLDAKNTAVMDWELRHVIPVRWTVSPFEAGSTKVALETLELAHMGFLTQE